MIRLDIQPYCSECFDFDPDVKKPEKIQKKIQKENQIVYIPYGPECFDFDPDVKRTEKIQKENQIVYIPSDTIIRCRYAKRCESIKRFLDAQNKKESAE